MANKYSVTWVNGKIASVEIDGSRYKSLARIPDPDDRDELLLLMSTTSSLDTSTASGASIDLSKIILPLFTGITILMWVIFAIATISTSRTLASEVTASGVVLDLVVRHDSNGDEFYYPKVEFTLPDSSLKRLETAEGNYPPAYYPGQQVTVLYNPEQPLSAHIKSTSSTINRWTVSIIFGFLGAAFLAGTIFAGWIIRQFPEPIKA